MFHNFHTYLRQMITKLWYDTNNGALDIIKIIFHYQAIV